MAKSSHSFKSEVKEERESAKVLKYVQKPGGMFCLFSILANWEDCFWSHGIFWCFHSEVESNTKVEPLCPPSIQTTKTSIRTSPILVQTLETIPQIEGEQLVNSVSYCLFSSLWTYFMVNTKQCIELPWRSHIRILVTLWKPFFYTLEQ